MLGRFSKQKAMHPRYIEKRMCRAIDEGARVFLKKVYAPNHITVCLNPEDMREVFKYRRVFWDEMRRTAQEHIEANLSLAGNIGDRIVIKILDDPAVPKGEVACTAELVDDLPPEEDS